MSDIFNNLYESNEKQTSVMERNADRALSIPKAETIPQPGKYFTDIINKSNSDETQKQEDIKKYSVNLPQEQYDIINTAISNAEVPEDEAFRWACALEYKKQFDLPLSYTYEHLEDINKGIWGERAFNPKTNFRAIVDYGHIGTNTLRQGFLGNAIMAQELSGNTDSEEYKNNIKEYQDIENSNLSLQDAQPRNWAITALKYGAQSLPFTGYVAGSGIVGSLLAPGAGTALAFATSMQQTLGQEYMDMRANGASPETAAKVGVISGALQAGVEVALGDVAHFMGKTAAAMGKDVIGSATRRAISEKITASCFKRLVHSGGVKQIAGIIGKEALSAAGEWTEEGAEEVVQEIISIMGKNIAASMDEYEVEHRSAGDIAKDLFEQFKGGAMGSIVLSGFPMAMGIKADFNDFRDVKNNATTIQSKEAFKKSVKDSRIFDGMDEEKKAKTEDDIWNSYAKERQDNADKQAKEYSEVYSAGEGMEEVVETEDAEGNQIVDENGSPVEKQQAYRTEDKKLYTQNDIQNEEDNKVKGRYKVGNGTESEKNLYGYIDYTLDSDKNTVTINKFTMSPQREDIRQEFYDGFAEKFAGNEIEWNPQWDAGKGIKQNLIDNNPGGKNNGLSYFAEEKDVTDFAVRKNVAQQIKKAMPNFSAGERGAAVALLEAGAKAQGKSISDYVAMTFSKNIFGDAKEAESLAQAQGKVIQGAQSWKQFAEGTRAVIYATEKADFSTWTHEIAHVWRKQLTGDLKAQAEKAFNVENGNWTTAQEEQFAVGFEDYLRTGKAPSNTLHTLYKELAQFLSRVYGALKSRVNITPEISKVYDQLLKGGDSVLRQAEAAVKQADEEYAKSNEKAVKSEQNVQKTAEKGAKTEQIGEPASDKIKSFFSGDNISKETAEETTETIKSPDSSLKEKNDASLNAASEAMMNDVALFQGEDAQIAAVREQYENTDKWMKAPNRKDTKLSEEQWLQVRTPNFKRWFGNWNYDENKQIEVTELDTKNLPFDWTDTGSLKNWLKESIVGKTVYNANNGSKIEFTPGKTKASIKRRGAEQRGAYSVIDKLVENAELFDFEENDGQEKHAALLGQDVYYSAMKAGDKYYSVKIKVDIGKTDLRVMYKDHKVSEIEIAPYPYHESAKAYHADIDAIHTFSIGQLAGNIKPQNISKVVDENGEPLVVYHGTEQAEFDIFKTDGSKTTNFATPSGTAWFTGDKDTAASYSGEYNEPTYKTIGKEYVPGIYSVFLNIKKPFIYDNKTDIYRPNDIVSNALKSEQYDGVILNGAIYDFGIYAEDLNTPVKIRNDYIAFNPNQIKSATDNSGAFNSNNPSILFQTAYHGSPYNFDNFSTENIGSGEGNQSFGWGLYFSNKKEVAEYYADKLSDEAKRNLYTVDITDGKFLQWDKAVPAKEENRIKKALFNILIQGDYKGAERELSEELNGVFTDSTGEYLYNDITAYLGSPKDASLFLKENGYTGLEYPGGTLSQAESKDTRNYIVFADKDVSITDHILFQTQSELMETAKDFNTWQEFMEFEQTMFSGDVAIPEFADAEWYQTVWEAAHGEQNTAQKNEEDMKTTARADEMNGSRPDVQDAMFMSEIQKKGKLEEFLRRIHEIEATEINESPEDDIEVAENEKLAELKRFIHTQLTHGVWLSNSMRAFKGRDILPATRQRMLTLMGSAARDYRAIYSEIMDNQDFKVDEKDSVAYKMKNNPLVDPNDDLTERSPEYRRQLAEKIQNMEMKRKIADGSLKLDDELDNYIKDLDSKVKESDKKLQALKDDIDSDYKSISDWQTRELLKLHEQMLVARAKYTRNDTTSRHIEKGIKISEKYMLKSQNLKADYDSIFRKYEDLKNSIVISEEAKNALKRQEDYEEIKQDNKERRTEKSAADKVKKMRIQLVKRTMRRVPFERVDYKNAYAIIAIQRIFEPNLEGGVNQWIGTEGSYLRGVWSSFITDAAKRENIIKYLSRKGKIAHRILDLLNNTKTADDFNSWSLKDRRDAHRVLPREDWIWSLHLANLSEERKGSIQQNIEETQQTRMVPSKKNPGEMVPQYYTTVTFGDDIRDIVREALGSDMFETLVHRPFAEWTTEEMETLAKRVDDLYVEGRDSLQAKKELEKEQARKLRDKIESAVRNTGIQINEGDPEDVKKKKQEKINKILGHTTSVKGTLDAKKRDTVINRILHGYGDANIRRVARILDNYTEGTNTNILYWKENDCFNRKSRAMQQRENTINTAMKNTGVTLEDLYNKVTIDNFYKGESRTFTVDELLYYLAADKDGNSRDACAYGCMIDEKYRDTYRIMDEKTKDADRMKTTDASGNELIASEGTLAYMSDCNALFDKILTEAQKLDKKYLDFSDAVADDYAIQFDRMNKLSIEEFGIPVWRVEKYVPLIRLESSGDTNQNRVREDLLGTSGVGAKTWVDKGMTQKRVAISPLNQKPVQSGLYTTWVDSVERTEHFIAYAPYVRELRRIYTSRDAAPTRQWIESRYTKGMLNYLDDYINEVANPNANSAQSSLDQVCRALRGKTATAYLAWKASSVVKQALTSPAPFMQFVNPKEYLAAAFKMISDKGTADAIRGKSAYMASRTMDPMVDLVKAQAEKSTNKIAHAVNSFNVMGMGGLEWIDWACVAPGWLAVYDKEYARLTSESKSSYETKKAELESNGKLNEEQIANELEKTVKSAAQIEVEAVSKADDATRLCQPSSRLTDLSPIFKSRGKNSEVAKAVLQFQTSLNVIWQNIRYDIPYAVRQKQYRQIAGTVLGYMVAGIAVTLICDSSGGDDDKGSDKMRKFLFSATTQFSDSVPVIGSAITRTTEKFITGKSAYSFGNSLFPLLDKIQQGTMSAASGDWEKAASKFAEGVALSTGLPVSGAKELLYTAGLGDGKKGAEFKPLSLAGRRD